MLNNNDRYSFKLLVFVTSLVLLTTSLVLLGGFSLEAVSQVSLDRWWETLGGNPYRTANLSPTVMSGSITGSTRWSFDASSYSALGYYPFDVNPLIANIDGQGGAEVVVVNSGGVVIILNGATTNTGGELLGYLWVDAEPHSTPALADLNNDGFLEIVVGTRRGRVVALSVSSTWSISYFWRSEQLDERISSSPLVVDLDNDGVYEVVVQVRSGLVCLDGSTGSILWRATVKDMVMVQSPTLLGDINGDGVLDVIGIGSFGRVYAVSGVDGSIIWETNLWSQSSLLEGLLVIHTPVVADTDGDGVREVVVSLGREVFGRPVNVVERIDLIGRVAVIDSRNGVLEAVIDPPTGIELFAWFSQPSIAAADVDSDGAIEFFIASADGGLYQVDYTGTTYSVTRLFWFDSDWNIPAMGPTSAGIALADTDGDNQYEVVLVGTVAGAENLEYIVYVYDIATNTTSQLYTTGSIFRERFNWPSLSIGDVDNDNLVELVIVTTHRVTCLE